jgi:hypothetical protein
MKPFLDRYEGTSGDVGGVSSSLLVFLDARLSVSYFESRMLDIDGRMLDMDGRMLVMDGLACLMLALSPVSVLTRDSTL